MKNKKKSLLNECKIIKENCEYTAEAHFTRAKTVKNIYLWLQIVPAIIVAIVGGAIVVGETVPDFVGWLITLSAIITGCTAVLNPLQEYYECFNAGNAFTRLKQEARSLKDTYSENLSLAELTNRVHTLQEKYADICSLSPLTDEKAFATGRLKIKSGIHDPD